MNQLPEHRRALYGRTFPQAWNPARAGSAIERPPLTFWQRVARWFWSN